MGFLRGRNASEEEAPARAYRMREKMLAIGDDFWIENGAGDRVFKVNGKALRIRKTLVLEDLDGNELLQIQERRLTVRDTMAIEHDGDPVAKVHKALISPLRERFKIELASGGEYETKGNIVDHHYRFEHDGQVVATVSKRWFRVRDAYGVDIEPGQDDALILAAAVCIDQMSHD